MEIVFNANTDVPSGRKRAAKACNDCHRSKKKCCHLPCQPQMPRRHPPASKEGARAQSILTIDRPTSECSDEELRATHPVEREGDLVPESILKDLSPSDTTRTVEAQTDSANGQVGGNRSRRLPLRKLALHDPRSMFERFRHPTSLQRTLDVAQKNYLQAIGAYDALPRNTSDALITTFVSVLDPCLPILDGSSFLRAYCNGTASKFLVKAICLVACKVENAEYCLRLEEGGALLGPAAFASRLFHALHAAVQSDLEPDRLVRIQILALMSLHHEGPRGVEMSSSLLCQAIHDCHTLSLHYLEPGRVAGDEPCMLWWTLRVLDRHNCYVGSRPIMLSNENTSIPRPPVSENGRVLAITVWLRLADLLEQVYSIYVPPTECDDYTFDIPSFDEICAEVDLGKIQRTHKVMLELCYHATIALSYRGDDCTSASYSRRSKAADDIQTLATQYPPSRLLQIPFLPYALSIALTVAYRDLRDNFKPPVAAMSAIDQRCEFLKQLSENWRLAGSMATLGKKVRERSKKLLVAEDRLQRVSTIHEDASNPVAVSGQAIYSAHQTNGNNSTQQTLSRMDSSATANMNHSTAANMSSMPAESWPDDQQGASELYSGPLSNAASDWSDDLLNGCLDPSLYRDLDGLLGDVIDTNWFQLYGNL